MMSFINITKETFPSNRRKKRHFIVDRNFVVVISIAVLVCCSCFSKKEKEATRAMLESERYTLMLESEGYTLLFEEVFEPDYSCYDLTISKDGSVWMTDYSSSILKYSPSDARKKENFTLTYDGKKISIINITSGTSGRMYFVWGLPGDRKNFLGVWQCGSAVIEKIVTKKVPRDLLWDEHNQRLLYLATDYSLNVISNLGEVEIPGIVSSVEMSPLGDLIVMDGAETSGKVGVFSIVNYSKRLKLFEVEKGPLLVGTQQNGKIVMYEQGVSKKGGSTDNNKLMFFDRNGLSQTISGKSVVSAAAENGYFLLMISSGDGRIRMRILKDREQSR